MTSARAAGRAPDRAPVRPSRLRVLLRPRMLVLLLVVLLAAAFCVRMGVWQWHRATERGAAAASVAAAQEAPGGPVGLGTLVAPQEAVRGDDVGRAVWVTGTYEPAGQRLVTGRALDGEVGYLVLTPLRVSDDGTGGASWAGLSGAPVVAVVRGWVASPSHGPGLEVPVGEVRVTGWLQAGEAPSDRAPSDEPASDRAPSDEPPSDEPPSENSDGPPLTDSIAPAALVGEWGGPIWDGYVVLTQSAPAQVPAADGGPAALPPPTIEGGTGLNLQSLFYSVEWAVFALFALAFYVRLARDEIASEPAAADPGAAEPPRPRRGQDPGIAGLPG